MTRVIGCEEHDYEGVIRDMIRHENDLVHQRMSWLLAFNGLMFAALVSRLENQTAGR